MNELMAILESQTINKGVAELVISVPVDALEPSLRKAATDLQSGKPLPGFRPGKAPYDAVRQAHGAMAIYEGALRYAVPAAYAEIISREKIQTLGDPEFSVTKLSPEQPLEFKATVALLPEVKLGDYKSLREERKPIDIPEADVNQVVDELRDMRATTALVDRPSTKEDRLMVDLSMSHEGVPLEGGQAKSHAIDLFKPYVIPGFLEEITGLKKDDQKKFTLPFPEDHYDKNVAGKTVEYDVSVKGVYEYKRPEANDEFAKTVGKFETMDELRAQLKSNLGEMQEGREEQRLERVIMDELIKKSTFGDIPEMLVQAEVEKLMFRIKGQVEREGGSWEDYLTHLKKTEVDVMRDLLPEAYTRIKAQLLVRAIAEAETIDATEDEVETERDIILSHYPTDQDSDIRQEIKSSEYDRHLRHLIITRKVMAKLKEIATQK